ncbi:hypothetical protein ACTXT7_015673 [Hymenolepis weldensis]
MSKGKTNNAQAYIKEEDLKIPMLIWLLFIILGPIHIYANWRAVRCLELTTFNRVRFNILVQDWLSRLDKKSDQVPRLLSVQEVNYLEPIISLFTQRRTIRLGCSFDSLLTAIRCCKPLPLMGVFSKERYILYCPEWKNSDLECLFLQMIPLIIMKNYRKRLVSNGDNEQKCPKLNVK